MKKPDITPTYCEVQYDDIEKLLADAERLLPHPQTRQEGRDLCRLAELKIKRETNRMVYAKLTGQAPNIPPLEPAPKQIEASAAKPF